MKINNLVYSVRRGSVMAVPIVEVIRRRAVGHAVMHVLLSGGTTLEISAGHPTADGRTFGDLHAGDRLGAEHVMQIWMVPFSSSHTYDILPASDSATYFAGGVLVGSSLAPMCAQASQ